MSKKRRNRGLSLIEILIAISVFSVLVGLTGLSVSMIKRANFKKAAEKVQRAVVTARTKCMAKGPVKGAILFNTRPNGQVVVKDTDASETFICNGSFKVSFVPGYSLPDDGIAVAGDILQFNTSGAIKYSDGSDTGGKFIIKSNDGSLRAEVIIYPVTGKTTLKYL